jgi:hypothetical protein
MGRRKAGKGKGRKEGGADGCEEGWRGRGMEGRRAAQRCVKKVGVEAGGGPEEGQQCHQILAR